jgi:hypothetical protein
MTTDGDLVLDVASLGSEPEITAAPKNAGFNEGKILAAGWEKAKSLWTLWLSHRSPDEPRRRRAQPDCPATPRALRESPQANVAGPAALLIAKAIKIQDRTADSQTGIGARPKEPDASAP